MKHDFGLNYMIQTQWLIFPKLMREIPSMSLETSNTFKRSIYILYVESIEFSVDCSLHAVFITSAGIWCSLQNPRFIYCLVLSQCPCKNVIVNVF